MDKKCEANSHKKQVDFLTASLLDFFRDPKNDQCHFQASTIALNHVKRIMPSGAVTLEKRYLFFASKLKNNITAVSLRNFAEECIVSFEKTSQMSSHHEKKSTSPRSLEKRASIELAQSLALGHSQASAIYRAANELVKEQNRLRTKSRIQEMTKSHPLGETLEALRITDVRLAKEDIRHHLLRLKRSTNFHRGGGEGVLFGLLEKAKAFAAGRLHGLLGDELFFLCRPVGFLDKNSSTLLVEVPTSAHLYALTYRKLEILSSLRKDNHFSATKKVQFRVTGNAF